MRIEAFLRQSPLFAIRRASRRIETDLSRILHDPEITFLEGLVLVSIFFEQPKPIKPSALAAALSTTRGNLSHCISSLESRGLVRRRIDPNDARALNIVLKPAGRSAAMQLVRTFHRLQRDLEHQLGSRELQMLLSAIEQVENLSAEHAAGPVSRQT